MRCGNIFRSAVRALTLGVFMCATSAIAATYTANVTYEGNGTLYYKVVSSNGGSQSQSCRAATPSLSYTNSTINTRNFVFYTDKDCKKRALAEVKGSVLFSQGESVTITMKADGTWQYSAAKPGAEQQPGTQQPGKQDQVAAGKKVIAFFTPWSNTNAVLYMNGDSVATMTAMKNYCGWFRAVVTPPSSNFTVYFKQTVGLNYVTAEGLVNKEPTIATEISLDSVASLGSDTIWIQGYKNDVPSVFSSYPKVLGDCPLKKFPVTVFDWLHGNKGDGEKGNGNPENGVSADFGSGGCGGSNNNKGFMEGMVEYNLGANGVPVPATPFPEKCQLTTHLADWFLPEVVAKDAAGNEYTNMTCRDLYISMDDAGFWLAEVSSNKISEGNEANKGGMFLVDDFKYLDDAQTILNPYYDNLNGSGGYHNFGFAVKIQATFEYVPGQYFDFYGDDDVWVFIDNRLAVDIGGQHGQVAGAVDLDTIGQNNGKKLVPGETYNFHIFYVERHVSSSNFRMRTSIDLQVDASIFLTSDKRGTVTSYDVWQVSKKNKLSCGYDASNTEVDTTGGASKFKLTGGNIDQELTPGKTYYEGLKILTDSTFSIDSALIVDKATLPPGHYFLEITLKSDPSQMTKVEIVVPTYAVPRVAFAKDDWTILGTEVSGDTLQIGEFAYATYKVNISFFEDFAVVTNYNKRVGLSFDNPNVDVQDSTGRKISYVNLDEKGRATFYIHANAAVQGVTLIAKGSAATPTIWTNLNFKDPPIPHVKNAIIVDRNGDGRADSMYVQYDAALNGESKLDSIQFTFGESFATTTKYKIVNNTDLIVTAESTGKPCSDENCGFGSRQITGGNKDVYFGQLNSWFTYTKNGKSTQFNTEKEKITDGVGPIVLKAVKTKLKDGNRELEITMSEAISDESRKNFANIFDLMCVRNSIPATPENPVQVAGSGNTLILIYSPADDDAVLPDNGDQIRFLYKDVKTVDLSGNAPHWNNPWVTITGDQEVSNEAPGVVALGEDPYGIISNPETTQPTLITNINQDVQSIGDSLGVQGHLIDFDISKIMQEETQNDIDALEAFIETRLGSTTTYDTVITAMTNDEALAEIFSDIKNGIIGDNYMISEETVAGVMNGTITASNYTSKMSKSEVATIKELVNNSVEASRDTAITISNISTTTQADMFDQIRSGALDEKLKKAGVSANMIEAIKNGTLNESNIEDYRSGAKTLVADTAVVLHYQTRYYSQFGEYVGGASKTIKCSDESVYGAGGCLANKGKLFLAWNMRSDSGRLVGTGVYIARLQMKIKVNGKTTLDQTRDKLMGVRRGSTAGLDLNF
ncbi:fibro-slime domain-containing protein [Fibrobacter sp. UWEL]|uniref:fibro-slime domain-containing protein n=1 Tax=Fibrobacter sp. UWEL TaxID=1896209 RepID=UPI000918BE0B|nr:fibro-slime domain-containing protein [Fibrobacter sp. UWEL]SHK96993.1 fibro-slime domain-containing protein [Fibrobacter sp. UWEL]